MAKKYGFDPFILLTEGGDPGVSGGTTGQGGSNPVPCSYDAWRNSPWAGDYGPIDGVTDDLDYATWWESNGFSQEDWEAMNPNMPWSDYFG